MQTCSTVAVLQFTVYEMLWEFKSVSFLLLKVFTSPVFTPYSSGEMQRSFRVAQTSLYISFLAGIARVVSKKIIFLFRNTSPLLTSKRCTGLLFFRLVRAI